MSSNIEGEPKVEAALLRQVIDLIPHYIFAKNAEGVYVLANECVANAYGTTVFELEGKTDADFSHSPDETKGFRRDDQAVLSTGKPRVVEEVMTDTHGQSHLLHTTKIPFYFPDANSPCILGLCMDITERRQHELQIRFLALHDSLTGLGNRTTLKTALDQQIQAHEPFALLFFDLDHFKTINDSLGHTVGDRYLVEISERVKGCVGDKGTVCRAGGDEFLVVLPRVGHLEAARVAESALTAIRAPVESAGMNLLGTSSVGIALYPEHGSSVEVLMSQADGALYAAKTAGRDAVAFFTHDIETAAKRKLAIHNGLKAAIAAGDVRTCYQPIVDASSRRIVGVEALSRWTSLELGVVSPAEFIPLAEETGIIQSVDDLALTDALRTQAAWARRGFDIHVAVNLSARQFQSQGFEEKLLHLCRAQGGNLNRLALEVTEGVLLTSIDRCAKVLASLRRSGVSVSIDDFGTGYSSLAYLRKLPISTLKIDRSFVMDCTNDPDQAAIVRAIIAMAKALRLHVVAEGVETEEQAALLCDEGCEYFQGYLFSRPVSAQEVFELRDKRLG
ncbi:MAG: EAL domain-containing protein [Myxococcales bacterium]|nr:EAL domain-containing protein [Myxococcales bacterium]